MFLRRRKGRIRLVSGIGNVKRQTTRWWWWWWWWWWWGAILAAARSRRSGGWVLDCREDGAFPVKKKDMSERASDVEQPCSHVPQGRTYQNGDDRREERRGSEMATEARRSPDGGLVECWRDTDQALDAGRVSSSSRSRCRQGFFSRCRRGFFLLSLSVLPSASASRSWSFPIPILLLRFLFTGSSPILLRFSLAPPTAVHFARGETGRIERRALADVYLLCIRIRSAGPEPWVRCVGSDRAGLPGERESNGAVFALCCRGGGGRTIRTAGGGPGRWLDVLRMYHHRLFRWAWLSCCTARRE